MNKDDFLTALYNKSGLDTEFRFGRDELLEELDIDEKTLNKFSNYWVKKGYLHGPSPTTSGTHMCLFFEAEGLDHVESLIDKNDQQHSNVINSKMKIFISHSSEDVELARSLVKLLHSALVISKQEIRCTSVSGFKLDAGANTDETIKNEIRNSEIFIGLITPNSLESSYVLFELGARWGIDKHLIPILGQGATYEDLPIPIRNKNAIMLSSETDIYDLLEGIAKKTKLKTEKISSYSEELSKVINHSLKKKD